MIFIPSFIVCIISAVTFTPNRQYDKNCFSKEGALTPPFSSLSLNNFEKASIYKIISTMGEKNILQLSLYKISLEKKGKRINHVHPLKFAGYIFTEPHLKICMREIKKSHFKWDGFARGFARRMHQEDTINNLTPYIKVFSQHLAVDQRTVTTYIKNKNWEGLLNFLIDQI